MPTPSTKSSAGKTAREAATDRDRYRQEHHKRLGKERQIETYVSWGHDKPLLLLFQSVFMTMASPPLSVTGWTDVRQVSNGAWLPPFTWQDKILRLVRRSAILTTLYRGRGQFP